MNIHQLSVRYLPEQDRILLSVNTTDDQAFDLWLTRRICLALLPQLTRMVVDHFAAPAATQGDGLVDLTALDANARKVLTDFRGQEWLQNADFKTPYRATTGTHPLGHMPLLATEITMKPGTDQQVSIHFQEQLDPNSTSRAVQMALHTPLVFSLMHMLGQALEHSQWVSPVDTANLPRVPSLTDQDRPRYLN